MSEVLLSSNPKEEHVSWTDTIKSIEGIYDIPLKNIEAVITSTRVACLEIVSEEKQRHIDEQGEYNHAKFLSHLKGNPQLRKMVIFFNNHKGSLDEGYQPNSDDIFKHL